MTADLAVPAGQSAVAKAMVSEIIADHRSDASFDATSILGKHPELEQFPSVVVDLAYEEFCRRVDNGEWIEPEQFVRRFPAVAAPLLKLLEVHAFLDENPDAFGTATGFDWPEAGADVAGFRLVREIGRGGFSRVFLAQEKALGDREVVLKICSQANEEAARLGQLNHPHIVPVHSVQFDTLPPFTLICMPLLGTTTMADLIRDGGDGPRHAKSIDGGRETYVDFIVRKGAELCDALNYAHRRNVYHCDVKPSNVLLATDGRALLLDFNLAMQHDHRSQVVGGTLPYMAPEQLQFLAAHARSTSAIDHRTDLYAFGVTMFQLLTGRLPYPTEHLEQNRSEAAHQLLDLQRASRDWREELEQVVSPRVARSIAACLAVDPQDRPDSAAVVAQQLRRHLTMVARSGRWIHAHRALLSSAAVTLLMVASVFGVWLNSQAPAFLRHYQMGTAALQQGDFAQANQSFRNALDRQQDFREALLLQGWSDLLASREPEIDQVTRDALQDSAYRIFLRAWNQYECGESAASLAQSLAEMGEYKEAGHHYEEAVKRGLWTGAIANNLGFCLLRSDQEEAALGFLNAAIGLDPSIQVAHGSLLTLRSILAQDATASARQANRRGMRTAAMKHESSAAKHLQEALDQIQLMRQFAPPSAELEWAAANIFALAISAGKSNGTDGRVTGEYQWQEQLFAACEMAINMNLPPERLEELLVLAPRLRDLEPFQRLRQTIRTPGKSPPLERIADIFPEVYGRLTIVEH